MNLICITESELAQWVSRRNFDTLLARILTDQQEVTRDIFTTAPYLKLEDARGRIVVNLKENWRDKSSKIYTVQNIEVLSISIDAISEIVPTMDQYAKRLEIYKLPIATWSIERVWDEWLINQAVFEIYRATVLEVKKIGCVDKEVIDNETLIKALIKKSLRPNLNSGDISILMGWDKVFALREDWLHAIRVKGELDSTRMFNLSVELINNDLFNYSLVINSQLIEQERGWEFQDITMETIQLFSRYDLESIQSHNSILPPLFCIAAYLRLYDEIHNGNKNWRTIFNLLRFTKYSVNSLHADIMTIALIASLKTEEIYKSNQSENKRKV
jgi:hypothetical protein